IISPVISPALHQIRLKNPGPGRGSCVGRCGVCECVRVCVCARALCGAVQCVFPHVSVNLHNATSEQWHSGGESEKERRKEIKKGERERTKEEESSGPLW